MGVFPLRVDGGGEQQELFLSRPGMASKGEIGPLICEPTAMPSVVITGVAVNGPADNKFYYFSISAMITLKYQ
jgi:hypothetical protein